MTPEQNQHLEKTLKATYPDYHMAVTGGSDRVDVQMSLETQVQPGLKRTIVVHVSARYLAQPGPNGCADAYQSDEHWVIAPAIFWPPVGDVGINGAVAAGRLIADSAIVARLAVTAMQRGLADFRAEQLAEAEAYRSRLQGIDRAMAELTRVFKLSEAQAAEVLEMVKWYVGGVGRGGPLDSEFSYAAAATRRALENKGVINVTVKAGYKGRAPQFEASFTEAAKACILLHVGRLIN